VVPFWICSTTIGLKVLSPRLSNLIWAEEGHDIKAGQRTRTWTASREPAFSSAFGKPGTPRLTRRRGSRDHRWLLNLALYALT